MAPPLSPTAFKYKDYKAGLPAAGLEVGWKVGL